MAIEFLSINEATEYLGISRTKMWQLVKKHSLTTYSDPVDSRKRLVRKDDLERFRQLQIRGKE